MKNFTNYLLSCLNEIKNLYVNGFNDFMTLIKEKKVQDALSWADTFKWDENKLGSRRQEVREKVRKLASEQLKDPVSAFKLLDILQKWKLNSVDLDSLQNLELELTLLYSLVRGNHFCEFYELLSQIQLRVIPHNFNYRSIHLFNMYEHQVHKLRKDCCEKIMIEYREISKLTLPLEIKTKMDSEIFIFKNFNENLEKQEEEMKEFLNDVLSEPLQALTAGVQSAEQRSNAQKVDLQQLRRENTELRTKIEESMTEMNDELQQQFKRYKQGFGSLRVIDQTNRLQNNIDVLNSLYKTLAKQVSENLKQNKQCEEDCKKVMQEIRRINPAMKYHPEIEHGMPQEVDKQRKTFGSGQKSTEELLLACRMQQEMNEKMMKLLQMNLQQNFEASENQDVSQAFSSKQTGPQQQGEERIHVREPKEKDADESGERDFDQEEKEERTEQISEGAFQQNDKEENPSTQASNNNTWEIVGQDQG